jgi:hypothetical protein
MRRLAALLLALLLVLVVAAPAAAGGPDKFDNDYEDSGFVDYCRTPGGAVAFEVWDHTVVHDAWKLYYDQDGNLVEVKVLSQGTDNLYNKDHPDRVLSGPFQITHHIEVVSYDPWTTIDKTTGRLWGVQLPDRQKVYFQSGQTVEKFINDKTAGILKEEGRLALDWDAICAALAQ